MRAAWPIVSLLALVSAIALILPGVSAGLSGAVVAALINLILVVGLYVFVGNSGVLSFGHVTFMAVGAYVCAILTIPTIARAIMIPNVPSFVPKTAIATIPAILAGALLAGVLGVIVGVPIVRLTGLSAGLAMFAVLLAANVVFSNWSPGPGGAGILTRVPTDLTVAGTLMWALLAMILAYLFQRSRWGLRLRGSRDDEHAARSLGVNVTAQRLQAMVLSAFITGIGGALYGHYVGSFGPDAFYIPTTFLVLAMLVVGGIDSLAGAVVGTLVISVISYALNQWTNDLPVGPITLKLPAGSSQLVVALLMLGILIVRPAGLMRGRETALPRLLAGAPRSKTRSGPVRAR